MIEVVDFKGDRWVLHTMRYCSNGWEMWMWASIGPLTDYIQIPVPIFTEWWE